MINEDNLKPFMVVTSNDLEEFENDCNDLIITFGYFPLGELSTTAILDKNGNPIVFYSQKFVSEDVDCGDCKCCKNEEMARAETSEVLNKAAKQLLVEPANETKKTTKKNKD